MDGRPLTDVPAARILAGASESIVMCRNIRPLFNFEPPSNADEVRAASLQYVRKISGFARPSAANEATFAAAVDAVTAASLALIDSLETHAPPRNREVEAAKAKQRSAKRFA